MKRQIFRSLLYLSVVAILFCVSPRSLLAQAVTGTLLGTVTDPGGAVVPGANVTITEVNTNFTRATVTNESGNYVIGNLDRGVYRIEIEHTGFKKSIREKVDVLVNSDTRVDVQLEPGGVAEQVEVTASVALLQTDRADVGRQIETKQLQDMPLAFNRNFQSLLNLVPGASRAERFHSEFFNSQDSLGSRVNGQSRLANNVQIEGIDNNHRTGLLTVLIPPIEALSSVNVTTSNYEAELGRAGGAVTNVTLRSGSNQIHGSVFEFNRVSAMAARPYFASRKAPTVYNQFGFTIGGPIKKNRTFFFGDYQGIRDHRGNSNVVSIPTLDFRNGDFRASPTIIYDPATGTSDGKGRQQIQCNGVLNVICPDRISSVARKILGFIPAPTRAGFTNNFELATVLVKNTESFDVKVDHKFSDDDSLFARYSFQRPKVFDPGLYGIYGGPRNDGFAGTGINRTQSGAVNYTHVFNPTFITEFRLGFTRYRNDAQNQDTGLKTSEEIGIPGVNLDEFTSGLAYIDIAGYTNPVVGFSPSLPWIRAETDVDLVSNWTKIFKDHTIKWGVDARLNKDDLLQTQTYSPRGRFFFRAGPTALNGGGASGFANAFASFLLDLPNEYGRDLPGTFPTVRQKSLFSYIQDKWTVTQKLTVNIGLRHEIYFAPTPMFSGGFSNYNPANNSLELAGIGKIPSDMGRNTNYKNFAPRLGVAYRLDEKTVIRAGYGISIDASFPDDKYAFNFPVKQNNAFTAANSFSAAGKMANGFAPPLVVPTPPDGIITNAPLNQVYLFIPLDLKEGYIQSWNLAVQRALPWKFTVEVAYVGNHNVGVLTRRDINASLIPGSGNAGRPLNAKFGRTTRTDTWIRTDTNYNGLQVKLDRRFSEGLLVTTAYTFSKAINYTDDQGSLFIPAIPSMNRGRAGYDRTHTFVQSYIYELPFGPTKRWLQSGIGRWILGDWQLNGIFSAYSGLPLDFQISATALNAPGNGNRPNLTGDFKVLGDIGPGVKWFDISGFSPPAPNTYGKIGRNVFSGPGFANLDLSFFRKFRLTERVGGEFRFETFNFTNTPQFNRPGSVLGNADFGQVTGTLGDAVGLGPRRIQLGLKLTF
ncbi:MAG TPA: TonB-dependent receptor [Blastocatellia bacterium]|nr:TonB-dependent receptor [Blastocatellia bacterium]